MLHEPALIELKAMEQLTETVLSLKQRGLVKNFGISAQVGQAQWLQANFPDIAEVLQIELPSQLTATNQKWIFNYADITFGHFRMQSVAQADLKPDEKLAIVANDAVSLNPNGTILFSSTKTANIKSFVTAIETVDKKLKG